MKSRVHPKYTTTYRVGNWAEYDRALVRRGDVTLWLTPDAIAYYRRSGPATAVNQLDYAFASHGFHEQVSVRAMNEIEEWGPSDHCRLMIEVQDNAKS